MLCVPGDRDALFDMKSNNAIFSTELDGALGLQFPLVADATEPVLINGYASAFAVLAADTRFSGIGGGQVASRVSSPSTDMSIPVAAL